MAENCIQTYDRNDLRGVLRLWLVPALPAALDRRIVSSFLSNSKSHIGIASPRSKPTTPEVQMKRCNACDEEFEDKFSLCPVDGTPLNDLAAVLAGQDRRRNSAALAAGSALLVSESAGRVRPEFNVTMIDSSVLVQRLSTELRFIVRELKRAWPELKHDPIGFARREAIESTNRLKRLFFAPNALAGTATALFLVLSAILSLMILGRGAPKGKNSADVASEDAPQIVMLNISAPNPQSGSGVGAGTQGRVGFNRGKGEGSEAEPKRSTGGGGGGDHSLAAAQQGRLREPSAIPAPILRAPAIQNPSLPVAGIDLDPALYKKLPFTAYGDPRSKSTTPSNGPGDGGGMGTGDGTGVGEGHGPGVGPGDNGNMGGGERDRGGRGPGGGHGNNPGGPDQVFTAPQVEQRVRVLAKPEPEYSEDARKNQITGTVVLRVVFSSSGEVTNIRAVRPLPNGLTEKAISAARRIRFLPAMKGGHPVNVYMQLEYNFNLY
jgi:TonB family protein